MSLVPDMKLKSFFAFFLTCSALHAQTPEWIWFDGKPDASESDQLRYFRKVFDAPLFTKAVLTVTGDDRATAFLNGKQVDENRNWKNAVSVDVTKEIKSGRNLLALRGRNNNGSAGVIAKLEFTLRDNRKESV